MIKRLRLTNFRRHQDTEIHFPEDSQVILIAGVNGVGKSTLLEAIMMGFYGESRFGRSNLDDLVRYGAELEGFTVELDFDVDGTEYQIVRKRIPGRSGKASAVLFSDGTALVEGVKPVTARVAQMFGMDAQAFRLAVIAQQHELNGLASLKPAERAEQLSRLLRLDVISKARDEARRIFRTERGIVTGLGTLDDLDALCAAAKKAGDDETAARAALRAAAAALTEIDAELAATADVDAAHDAASRQVARAEGIVDAADAEVRRLTTTYAALTVPKPVNAPETSLEDLTRQDADVQAQISRGEMVQQVQSQQRMLTTEQNRAGDRLAQIRAQLAGTGTASMARLAVASLIDDHSAAEKTLTDIRAQLAQLREDAGATATELKITEQKLADSAGLGAVCDACGQSISDEHRRKQAEQFQQDRDTAKADYDQIVAAGQATREQENTAQDEFTRLAEKLASARETATTAGQLEHERSELQRRVDTYTSQLERLIVEDIDMDELFVRKAAIAVELTQAHRSLERIREREAALARRFELDEELRAAATRLADARTALGTAAIDANLQAAYDARRALTERRADEAEMVHYWEKESALTEERAAAVAAAVTRAEQHLQRRREHETRAQTAANTGRVLRAVEEDLNTQIRPELEAAVSDILSTLSEGRFTAVRIDSEYNLTVFDDGQFRQLTHRSGGELDLIALAVRLALAGVVAGRHGGGTGFLILDECLGSQDDGRREAIMAALRHLRVAYGQILLISHVGGIEDAADTVIELTAAIEDDGIRYVEVCPA